MPRVEYQYQFPYLHGEHGNLFPGLLIDLYRIGELEDRVVVPVHIDTGAEYSLLDGELATAIGLNLMEGRDVIFNFTSGDQLPAKRHEVAIEHEELGPFHLVIAFSTQAVRRSILGRDFLGLVQIGFREWQSELYITPTR